jgi:hypothetical protein
VPHLFGVLGRTTVWDWQKAALQDASLRDMLLRALGHTPAATWLAGGNSLKYVCAQRFADRPERRRSVALSARDAGTRDCGRQPLRPPAGVSSCSYA